jgi:hypothetical protein
MLRMDRGKLAANSTCRGERERGLGRILEKLSALPDGTPSVRHVAAFAACFGCELMVL